MYRHTRESSLSLFFLFHVSRFSRATFRVRNSDRGIKFLEGDALAGVNDLDATNDFSLREKRRKSDD